MQSVAHALNARQIHLKQPLSATNKYDGKPKIPYFRWKKQASILFQILLMSDNRITNLSFNWT